jgi:putative transposase
MSNHFYFIVPPFKEDSLGKVFGITHMRYSHYFNKKKGAKGHLWQGRFYSCPLEADHLSEAIRYVELNPYRAKMVSDVAAFYWSSSRDRLNKVETVRLSCVKEYIDFPNW